MTGAGGWRVEFYADQGRREPCREWADGLSPQKRAAFTAAVRLVLARRGMDVVETEYGKALGGGLYEFRVRWEVRAWLHDLRRSDRDSAIQVGQAIGMLLEAGPELGRPLAGRVHHSRLSNLKGTAAWLCRAQRGPHPVCLRSPAECGPAGSPETRRASGRPGTGGRSRWPSSVTRTT